MHVAGKEIIFHRKTKLYVASKEDIGVIYATIDEKKTQYTKEQVRKAEQAYEILKNAGYPSPAELVNLLNGGNIIDLPALQHADAVRAYDIFGPPLEYV